MLVKHHNNEQVIHPHDVFICFLFFPYFLQAMSVNLNTQNNFIHEDTNLRFHLFTRIWFEKGKTNERKESDSKRKYHKDNTLSRFAGS